MLTLLKEILTGKKAPQVPLEVVVKNTQFKAANYIHELDYNEWCKYIHKEVRKKYYSRRKK
jgi:hypothetical protein